MKALTDYISRLLFLSSLLFIGPLALKAQQQHTKWLTGIKDTSYSNHSDYLKTLKQYVFIALVPDSCQKQVKEYRNQVYASTDKRDLHIDAFIPIPKMKHQRKPTPAVMIIHGGGWRSGDRSQHIPLAQHLAAQGIASFTVEYRLSTEAFFPAAVYDLKAAVRWLRHSAAQYNLDTGKIYALGFSAGGELAAFLGMTSEIEEFAVAQTTKDGKAAAGSSQYSGNSSKVNAVIDIDGTLSFVHPEASETQHPEKTGASAWWLGYRRTERLDLWQAASPLTYADHNTVPFLFLNSSVKRMHAGRDDFKKMMIQRGITVKVIEYPDTPHSFCLYRPWFPKVVSDVTAFIHQIN